MAQIIKHRRGSITQLKDVTARIGELVVATGSISDLNGPMVFVGETEGVAGAYRPLSKIYQGASAPTITVGSHGSVIDGTPFYASGNKSLYILSKDGNSRIDLTGNIEGNTVANLTITSLTGSNANITNITGDTVTVINNQTIGGTLGVTGSTVFGGSSEFLNDVSVTGDFDVNSNFFVDAATGDITGSNLRLSGNADIAGNIVLGGNITIGDQTTDIIQFGGEVSSSIVPDVHNAFDLGSSTQNWRNLHVSGTAYIDVLQAQQVNFSDLGILNDLTVSGNTYLGGTLDVTGNTTFNADVIVTGLTDNRVVIVGTSGLLEDDANFTFDGTELNVGQGNFTVQQGSGNLFTAGTADIEGAVNITGQTTHYGDVAIDSANTLYADHIEENGTNNGISYFAGTGGHRFDGNVNVTGNTVLNGVLTVNSTSELQGAVGVNSTLDVTGSAQFKSTINVDSEATLASATVEDLTQDRIVTVGAGGSLIDSSGFTYNGTVFKIGDGQFEVDTNDGDIRTSGSLRVDGGVTINGNQTINGVLTVTGNTQLQSNLYVSGNLEVLGGATNVTIQSQTVELDDNIIRLNAYSPFERYAGFEVIDSGSTGVSASLVWDGLNDYWMFVSSSGESSKLIGTTAGTYGSENSLTNNTIAKGTGANTIGDSLLTDDSTTLAYNTNKFTVASTDGATLIAGNVTLTAAGGADAGNNTSAIIFRNSSNVLGYISTTETTDVLDGILGYKNSDGALVFSTVIDGGGY